MPFSQQDVLDQLERINIAALLADLVSRPSFEKEEPVGQYLQNRFRSLGLPTSIRTINPGRFNVVTHYGSAGPELILNSHMDTVPPGDHASWSTPPLEPVVAEGRLHGRGACDAKGSLAAMAAAVEALVRADAPLRGRVTLMAVAYEETGALGSIAEAQQLSGQRPDAIGVIIGEPTELQLHLAHKGVIRPRLITIGRAAHASVPEAGVNAIAKMAGLVDALGLLGQQVAQRHHPLVGHASMVVTIIQGGVAANVVPDRCQIVVDRRLIPGEDLEEAQREIEAAVSAQRMTDPLLEVQIETGGVYPPSETADSEPFVLTLQESARKALGRPAELSGFLACCDMWPFRQKGLPGVIFGPGDLAQAHTTQEWIELAQVEAAARFYALAALDTLGTSR